MKFRAFGLVSAVLVLGACSVLPSLGIRDAARTDAGAADPNEPAGAYEASPPDLGPYSPEQSVQRGRAIQHHHRASQIAESVMQRNATDEVLEDVRASLTKDSNGATTVTAVCVHDQDDPAQCFAVSFPSNEIGPRSWSLDPHPRPLSAEQTAAFSARLAALSFLADRGSLCSPEPSIVVLPSGLADDAHDVYVLADGDVSAAAQEEHATRITVSTRNADIVGVRPSAAGCRAAP